MHAPSQQVQRAHEKREEERAREIIVARVVVRAAHRVEHGDRSADDLPRVDAELLEQRGLVKLGAAGEVRGPAASERGAPAASPAPRGGTAPSSSAPAAGAAAAAVAAVRRVLRLLGVVIGAEAHERHLRALTIGLERGEPGG